VPPLRERCEDIPTLVEHLLDDIANRSGQAPMELSREALALLARQAWKGNVRELRNLLERAQLDAEGPLLDAAQLQPLLTTRGLTAQAQSTEPLDTAPVKGAPVPLLAASMAQAERQAIQQALAACNGNRRRAASELGISRASLYNKLQHHGLSQR
jgi:DNA-binding NtrC family response regulator